MSDPIGTQGATKTSDLEHALEGGPGFDARLRELAAAKENAEVALKAFNLGKEAKAAYNEARVVATTAIREAEEIRRKATSELNSVEAEVRRKLEEAGILAQKIKDDASGEAAGIMESTTKAQADANAYAQQKREEADAVLAEAHAKRAAAVATHADAESTLYRHRVALDAAQRADEDANSLKSELTAKLQRLSVVVDELSK